MDNVSTRGGIMEEREYTMEELLLLIEAFPEEFVISIDLEVDDGS